LLLGHRNLTTTARYLLIATSKVCAAVISLESTALRWARRARENRQSEGEPDGWTAAVRAGGPAPLDHRSADRKPDLSLRALQAELKARGPKGNSFARR
jgi:hypothetical protein